MDNCTCEFKKQMITEMRSLRKGASTDVNTWVSALFQDAQEPCCLLTFLFYYAYCKECDVALSEEARTTLRPLMEFAE